MVALRKESVDRNVCACASNREFLAVALRKESVDRNTIRTKASTKIIRSLSARRAWIEIIKQSTVSRYQLVALRKESVDRNSFSFTIISLFLCRSPQGERG